VCRDDDLGRPRLEHRDRVAHRVRRIGIDDEPVRAPDDEDAPGGMTGIPDPEDT
jgi:hypothetical protein